MSCPEGGVPEFFLDSESPFCCLWCGPVFAARRKDEDELDSFTSGVSRLRHEMSAKQIGLWQNWTCSSHEKKTSPNFFLTSSQILVFFYVNRLESTHLALVTWNSSAIQWAFLDVNLFTAACISNCEPKSNGKDIVSLLGLNTQRVERKILGCSNQSNDFSNTKWSHVTQPEGIVESSPVPSDRFSIDIGSILAWSRDLH